MSNQHNPGKIQNMEDIKLIVGLGNPEEKYENTYHNVGFLIIDLLTENQTLKEYKNFAYTKQENYILAKPLTYMNNSGLAVKEMLDFFDLKTKNILIIHDDSDNHIGKAKFTEKGGSGGHNGINSIIDHIKTDEFKRFKIGVRNANDDGPGRRKSEEFVLKKMSETDKEAIYNASKSLIVKLKLNNTSLPTLDKLLSGKSTPENAS